MRHELQRDGLLGQERADLAEVDGLTFWISSAM